MRTHASAEAEQVRAWERELEILRATLVACGDDARAWGILLESPMLRLGKRMDAVLLLPGAAAVIEFKIGARRIEAADKAQVERYALLLRDFHAIAQSVTVVPILCAEHCETRSGVDSPAIHDGVADVIVTGAVGLTEALSTARSIGAHGVLATPEAFDGSPYRPTPTIVEAARALYAGHGITDIGRGDAADAALKQAGATLLALAARAERDLFAALSGRKAGGATGDRRS